MEPAATWDPKEQVRELNAWRRHQTSSLTLTGVALGLVNALLVFEVLSMNEDTNTFFVLGGTCLAMNIAWLAIARRAGAREQRWALKARRIEQEILRVPDRASLWDSASDGGLPAWIAAGAGIVGFIVLWIGLMAYAALMTYVVR